MKTMLSREEREQESVCEQVDLIMETYFDQFTSLVSKGQNDDAISIGDEVREWMKEEFKDTILYYNTKELRKQYRELVNERKKRND